MNTAKTQTSKQNLLGKTQAELEHFFAELGEPKFRAAQVFKWIHQRGVVDFADMTDISKALRQGLDDIATITFPEVIKAWDANDGCRKFLIRVAGGSAIEAVFIPERGRGTLCVSSQVGCSLDCSF